MPLSFMTGLTNQQPSGESDPRKDI